MKNFSKYILIFLIVPFVFSSCSDDDDNDGPSEPTNFFEAHVGVWKTTVNGTIDLLLDVYSNGSDTYTKLTSETCYTISPSNGGSTTVHVNTPTEFEFTTTGIPASNVFDGADLDALNNAGYTTLSVAGAYGHTSATVVSFAEIMYAGNFDVELLTLSGNLGKQSSDSFSVCREMSNYNNYYKISEDALSILNK